MHHNCWTRECRTRAPQEKPLQWEARALQQSSPYSLQLEKARAQPQTLIKIKKKERILKKKLWEGTFLFSDIQFLAIRSDG